MCNKKSVLYYCVIKNFGYNNIKKVIPINKLYNNVKPHEYQN